MEFTEQFYDGLEEYLDEFPVRIISRGEDLAYNGSVDEVSFNPTTRKFSSIIYGSKPYKVGFSMNRDMDTVIERSCNCPYQGDCKHLAALAHFIWAEESEISLERKPAPRKKAKLTTTLKGMASSGVYTLTNNSIALIAKDLPYFKTGLKNRSLQYNQKIQHILEEDNQVRSTIFQHTYNWALPRNEHVVTFSITKKTIDIKCKSCAYKKNELCTSAYISLQDLLGIILSTKGGALQYTVINAIMAADEKVEPEVIAELFHIEISRHGKTAIPKTNELMDSGTIKSLKNAYLEKHISDEENILRSLELSVDQGEAFVWSSRAGLEYERMVFVMKGKMNKAKDKLISQFEKIDTPILLSDQAQKLYLELGTHNFDGDTHERYEKDLNKIDETLHFLRDSIDGLKNVLHYSYHPLDQYHSYAHKIRKKDISQFQFSDKSLIIDINASKQKGIYILTINYLIEEERIDISAQINVLFNWHFAIINGIAYIYKNPSTYQLYNSMGGMQELKFLPKNKEDYFQLLTNLEKNHTVHRDESINLESTIVTKLKKRIKLTEVGHHVLFYPELTKSRRVFNILSPTTKMKGDDLIIPSATEVASFAKEFCAMHESFTKGNDNRTFKYLHRDDYIKNGWHLSFFEKCKEQNIAITGLDKFKNIRFSSHKAVIDTDFTSAIDWFELDVVLTFGKEKVERKKWIKAIKSGQSYVELADGTLGIIPDEWFEKMTKMLSLSEVSKSGLRINKLRFNVIDELFGEIKDNAVLEDIKEKKMRLASYNTAQRKVLPTGIKATLRPYQEESYQWLKFLESCRFGGILADDMGLGKTLQIITLLAAAREMGECNALVIVPKSLIFNWVNEIAKFYPDLNHHIHHGTQRHEVMEALDNADIVISTYDTITRDIEKFRKIIFSHIILDESQAIKNPASKRYKALRLLQSPFKLCATGTPIQNNTFDLYAQASFANPGLLGNQSYFRQNFAKPIDKEGDKEASDLLLKMIHPFILRRTKEQVAQDLPDKVESTIICEMFPYQRKMYDELKDQIRRDLLSMSDDDGKLKFMVLDGLLRLRQLCNSPMLVDKTLTGEDAKSVKIESLMYKLTEEIGDGNALVFSQFVQMLSLIRKELDHRNIPYAYLDGSTRDREAVVNRFMTDDNCKIFLISLKAGNTGLNLTKAQYVFIIDPWWNPAVEAQAIDRTHRIGQDQKVFAYKMICKDTIEEKIILLQKRKKKVAKTLIQTDEATFKSLNKKDLMALFT